MKNKTFIKISETTYIEMEKSRPTKYIKRLPHPSGKGYIYFYTNDQITAYKKHGIIPGEEKKKGLFSGIMSFFKLKTEKQAEERAKKDYVESNVKERLQLTFSEWVEHLNEYLRNKERWDALILKKLQAQKDVQKTTPGSMERKKELSKEAIAEKNVSSQAKKNGFNFKVMYHIFNFYKKQEAKEEYETIQDTRDDANLRQYPISAVDDSVHPGRTEGRSLSNVPEREPSDNAGVDGIPSSVSGERSGRDVRLTKTQIKATRQAILDLLASKTDEEMTEEDKALLRQYEGAGGLDEKDKSVHGTLYEYYTPRNVVSKMWSLVEKYAGTGRKDVLEPSAGIGRFAENKDHDFTMFELDETSARINSILFPDADVLNKAFQEMFMKGGIAQKEYKGKKFQIAIGNPPYGEYSGFHKGLGEGKHHTTYQEYFIERGLDALEDGGIMAYIVPSGFLRGNKYSEAKSAISKKGRLLEAYRLPNGTFSTTGVGTDIIIIRKEQGSINDFLDDQYFKKNPDKILGEQTTVTGRFGPEQFVKLKPGDSFDNVINNIDINSVPVVAKGVAPQKEQVLQKTKINIEKKSKVEKQKADSKDNFETMPDVETETIESFNRKYNKKFNEEELGIWKATNADGFIESGKLSARDKKYMETSDNICVEDGKYIHKTNYASGDIYKKLENLERNKDNLSATKYEQQKRILTEALPEYKTVLNFSISPISDFAKNFKFSGDVEDETEGKSIVDRFMDWAYGGTRHYSMNWDGGVSRHDIPSGISWSDILDYINQKPVSADKRAEQEDKDFSRAKKVELRRDVAEKLFKRFLETGLAINEQKELEDRYNKQFNAYVAPDYSAIPIFMEGMSSKFKGKDLIVKDKQMQGVSFLCNKGNGLLAYDVGVGKTMTGIIATVNQMQAGRAKKPVICVPKAVYKNWIKEIRDLFPNIKINDLGNLGTQFAKNAANIEEGSLSVMTYEALGNITFKEETIHGGLIEDMLDSQQMTGEGMSDRERSEMKEKIMEKLGNAVKSKSIAVSSEDREQGWNILKIVKKEGLKRYGGREISPSSIKEAYKVFGEEIMLIKEGSSWSTIHKKTGLQIQQANTKDGVIEATKKVLSRQGEEGFTNAIKNSVESKGIINAEDNFETMPEDDNAVKSGSFFLEDLGFDHITVDEVHNFKNIFGQAKPQKQVGRDGKEKQTANEFQGLTGSSSDRGMKMFALTQVIQQQNNDRNIFALSATPFTNSPLEIYNILSLVARKRLKELGIYNLHEFMAQFAKLKSEWAIKSDGKIERKSVMKEFQNLSALQSLIREYIDKIDGEEAGVIRPNKNTQLVQIEMSEIQKKMYQIEMERFDQKDPNGRPVPGATLKAINNMRMITVSPHLINMDDDELYQDSGLKEMIQKEDMVEDSPKLKFIFDCTANFYETNKEKGQVIYMPRGTKQYSKMVDNLVGKGVPKKAIATIDSSTAPDKKEAIMASFNDPNGDIKIIIGSETIKEGVNLNGNSAILYNALLGWNPSETTQVEGRIWRQGNKQGQVHIVYPQLVDSVDAAMYQKHDEKSERFKALWSFKGDMLNVEDINPEELKFEIIKDPEKRAKFQMDLKTEELDNQVREKRIFIDTLNKYQSDLSNEKYKAEAAKKQLPAYENDVADAERSLEEIEKELKEYKATANKKDDPAKYEIDISRFDRMIRGAKDKIQSEKRYVREEEKKIKFAEQNIEGILSRLNGMGISESNIGGRIASEESAIVEIEEQIKKIKDSKQEFIDQAKAEIAASRKSVPPLEKTIKDSLDLIKGNLQPMEEVLKEMKKAFKIIFKKIFNAKIGKYQYYRI
jgi:hypothetical protein